MVNSFGGGDPGVATLSHVAWIEFLMGNFEEARKGAEGAILVAGEMGHPYSINFALMFAANLYQAMQDVTTAEQYIGLAMSVSVEQEFTLFTAVGKIIHGWTLVQRKKVQKGIDEILNGLELYNSTGSLTSMPYYLSLLAEGYRDAGQFDVGMRTLDDAIATMNKTGDKYWEAEIYRLKGEMFLLLDTSCTKQAHECFHGALSIARKQHATTLELRTATSLSRLLLEQGNPQEAKSVIAEVYNKFKPQTDNADLRIAKELIDVLG
jgi:tetratricopeptide (TPR) repeat protein